MKSFVYLVPPFLSYALLTETLPVRILNGIISAVFVFFAYRHFKRTGSGQSDRQVPCQPADVTPLHQSTNFLKSPTSPEIKDGRGKRKILGVIFCILGLFFGLMTIGGPRAYGFVPIAVLGVIVRDSNR